MTELPVPSTESLCPTNRYEIYVSS